MVRSITAKSNGYLIEFDRWRPLNIPHDRRLQKGWYFADPAEYESGNDSPT
jgi:hypothetical protein